MTEPVKQMGSALADLRRWHYIEQSRAAADAGISRDTARRLENGDPGVAVGQMLRYLHVISPGTSLLSLLKDAEVIRQYVKARKVDEDDRRRRLSRRQYRDTFDAD